MEIQNYFFSRELEELEVADGLKRKVVAYHDNLMMVEIHFKKGTVAAMHSHPHEQITYIISGKFEFTVGGKKAILVAGDSTFKQPNIMHGAVCLEDGVLIDAFTPARKDFL